MRTIIENNEEIEVEDSVADQLLTDGVLFECQRDDCGFLHLEYQKDLVHAGEPVEE